MESVASIGVRNHTGTKWLFSLPVDVGVFLGSAVVAMALLWIGARAGVLESDTPDWAWIPCVLLVDVAHVYSTGFKVYLDRNELARRPVLYTLVPVLAFLAAFVLYATGEMVFWRALAYLAVFHFVRQQYGWVALYRSRCGEYDRVGHWLDAATIYAATLYPLAYWHAHLPRRFWWFLENDFWIRVPERVVSALEPLYWTLLALYVARSLWGMVVDGRSNPGKDMVVATTAVCWYVGIVSFNSDYAFTVTNVIIHGVPYLALVYFAARRRSEEDATAPVARFLARGIVPFLAVLWLLAYVEEMLWDRAVWQDRSWFFGSPWDIGMLRIVLVPLLVVPQVVHYVLDGFIWRRRERIAHG